MRSIAIAHDVFDTVSKNFSLHGRYDHIFVFVAKEENIAAIKDKRNHVFYFGRRIDRYGLYFNKIDCLHEDYTGFCMVGYDLFTVKSIGFLDNEELDIFKILAIKVGDPSTVVYLVNGDFHSEDILI